MVGCIIRYRMNMGCDYVDGWLCKGSYANAVVDQDARDPGIRGTFVPGCVSEG